MNNRERKADIFDFVGAFEQAWIQYKSNFIKFFLFGIATALPPVISVYAPFIGIVAIIFLEGALILFMVDAISVLNNHGSINLKERFRSIAPHYLKNGFIITIFILPLIILGFAALIIPSIIVFSFFMFSFSHVANKHKFAIDACMESFRQGYGYRLNMFLLSLILYASIIIIYILTNWSPILFLVSLGLTLPYFFAVIEEFFEQLENK